MFKKVLVANRGEIALRVIRTLRELGIRPVAVASEADRTAPHALAADELEILGPAAASRSYLDVEAILRAARKTGSEAIHPGYGFLSENAAFAEACEAAGLVFIGPSPDAIRAMGSKIESRVTARKAGVPVIPGFEDDHADPAALMGAAGKLGYPVLVKATSGGGGKGMRLVERESELLAACAVARSEAEAAFGDGRLYLEKWLRRPRHIEIQVLGDASGRVIHLGERECSVQRRHQKILEESPSPAVAPGLRARMGEAAVRVAEAVGYRNAGTVEMLLDENGDFYFLEMNTRLQVEHPVTELVYGVDLVAAQLRVAAGEAMPFESGSLAPRGHAIEARVYAEDPARDFMPQIGRILRLRHPEGPGIRVDSGLAEGLEISVHYDPLLAKVIAWGETREAATARLARALRGFTLLGLRTNLEFLVAALEHPAWRSGRLHNAFVEEHLSGWPGTSSEPPLEAVAAAVEAAAATAAPGSKPGRPAPDDPWTTLGPWQPLRRRS